MSEGIIIITEEGTGQWEGRWNKGGVKERLERSISDDRASSSRR